MNYLAHEIKVLGKRWVVYYCPKKYYKKKCGNDSVGLADIETKEIFLLIKTLSSEVVAHELTHAYLSELCLGRTDLDPHQLEEVFAEMVGKYGKVLVRQVDQIIDAYHILRRRVEAAQEN